MKFKVTYTRTLTLEEEFEADNAKEAEEITGMRLSDLRNIDYDEAELEATVQSVDGSINLTVGPW